jgi:glyceraldehyde-3-phosphate dehydrogenase (NADP+)
VCADLVRFLRHPAGKGSEIGDYLTTHPGVSAISFTGGDTGIAISRKAGMVPLQMELGGKDACIVCRWVEVLGGGCVCMQGCVCIVCVLGGWPHHQHGGGGACKRCCCSSLHAHNLPVSTHLHTCTSDADIALAASHIVKGGFSYSGQRCTAVKVVLVMEDVADDLVARVSAC